MGLNFWESIFFADYGTNFSAIAISYDGTQIVSHLSIIVCIGVNNIANHQHGKI